MLSVIEKSFSQFVLDKNNYYGKMLALMNLSKNFKQEEKEEKNKTKNNQLLLLSINEGDDDIMKGITKRKNGLYMVRKTIDGVRKTIYAKTLIEAKSIYSKLCKNKIKGNSKNKGKTLQEFSNEWLEIYKKPFIKEKSFNDIFNIVAKINQEFGNTVVKKITATDIQIWINKLPANRTKERICTYFNALLQKATDLNIITSNPFKAVIKSKKGVYKKYAFTYAEQKIILDTVCGTDIETTVYVYLLTGCRPSEIPNKAQIDLDNNIIHICGTKNQNAKHRVVEISDDFKNYLQNNLDNLKSYDYTRQRFKELLSSKNLGDTSLYRLRHTFATNHFTLGTPAKQVQEWLGHGSITLTLDTYTEIDKTASKESIKKLYSNYYYTA